MLLLFQIVHRSRSDDADSVVSETVTLQQKVDLVTSYQEDSAFTALFASSGDASVFRRVEAIRALRPSFRVKSSSASSVESSSTSPTSTSTSSDKWTGEWTGEWTGKLSDKSVSVEQNWCLSGLHRANSVDW